MDISIIIPVYNDEYVIPRLFLTLRKYINKAGIEILVIDDCSTDKTFEILREKNSTGNIKNIILLKNDRNKGPAYARNRGLERAKGDYIAFLDSDDAWHSQKLDIQIELMKRLNIPISATIHKVITTHEFEEIRNRRVRFADIKFHYVKWPYILFKSPFSTPSVVLHKSLQVYQFDESFRYSEDFNLWTKIIYQSPAIKINYPLTYTFKHDYLSGDNSLNAEMFIMQKWANKNYIDMVKAEEYSFLDKLFIFLALIFNQIKFAKRVFFKVLIGFKKIKIFKQI